MADAGEVEATEFLGKGLTLERRSAGGDDGSRGRRRTSPAEELPEELVDDRREVGACSTCSAGACSRYSRSFMN